MPRCSHRIQRRRHRSADHPFARRDPVEGRYIGELRQEPLADGQVLIDHGPLFIGEEDLLLQPQEVCLALRQLILHRAFRPVEGALGTEHPKDFLEHRLPLPQMHAQRKLRDVKARGDASKTFHANTAVSDATAVYLSRLTGLKNLSLELTDVTDAGLEYLAPLTGLRVLSLDHMDDQITDAGMAHVARLHDLRRLYLMMTDVTDVGLARLHALERLEFIELCMTAVTAPGFAALNQALPKCRTCSDPDWSSRDSVDESD